MQMQPSIWRRFADSVCVTLGETVGSYYAAPSQGG